MEFTQLEKIAKDFDDTQSKGVFNPLNEDFTVLFGGKPVTIKSGEFEIWPEHKANHVAKHLADKICRDSQVQFLQDKFPGLDDNSREKWRVNDQHLTTREDLKQVKEALLFDPKERNPQITMPKTKFDPLIDKNKAAKNAGKGETPKKEEEKASDEKVAGEAGSDADKETAPAETGKTTKPEKGGKDKK